MFTRFPCAKTLVLFAASVSILSGCRTTGDAVDYEDPKEPEKVTIWFGSTDVQLIAEKMSESMLQYPAVQDIIASRATVVASTVANNTDESIDTRLITDTIRTNLRNNGMVFVLASDEMQNQIDELARQNQSGLYDKRSIAHIGKMVGARYSLVGRLNSIVKDAREKGVVDVYYKIHMDLYRVETGVVEWSGEAEIRKTRKF